MERWWNGNYSSVNSCAIRTQVPGSNLGGALRFGKLLVARITSSASRPFALSMLPGVLPLRFVGTVRVLRRSERKAVRMRLRRSPLEGLYEGVFDKSFLV